MQAPGARSVVRAALVAVPAAVALTVPSAAVAAPPAAAPPSSAAPSSADPASVDSTVAPLLSVAADAPVADGHIVVLEEQPRPEAADARRQVRQQAVAAGGEILFDYGAALNGFAVAAPTEALDTLRRDPRVAYIQPNLVHEQPRGAPDAPQPEAVQTDPPWHLDRVDQRHLPMDDAYEYDNDGQGVHAYVVDSGIRDSHVEFGNRVVSDYTAIQDGRGTDDCDDHGTFVASEVGGSTYGVAKEVTLHAVRVLDCSGTGTTAEIVAGMDWVAAHHQDPNVANVSIQSTQGATDTAMDQAAAGMIDAGVNLVLIAGNFDNADCTNSPKDPRALITAATDSSDARNTGPNASSYGSCVDIWAPGASITGAGSGHDSEVLTDWYGTSMAAPLVTGTVAMALESHPHLTMTQVYDLITDNATTGVLSGIGNSPDRLLYSQALTP